MRDVIPLGNEKARTFAEASEEFAEDARGSGASFGYRPCPWSPDEVADYGQIIDWIRFATPQFPIEDRLRAIELAIETALLDAGFEARIERVLSPAWTTDWLRRRGEERGSLRRKFIPPRKHPRQSPC